MISEKHCRIIYIDTESLWWLAEAVSGDPQEGAIQLIEPYPNDLKHFWNGIIKKIGLNAQKMVLFYKDNTQCYEPAEKVEDQKKIEREVLPA